MHNKTFIYIPFLYSDTFSRGKNFKTIKKKKKKKQKKIKKKK